MKQGTIDRSPRSPRTSSSQFPPSSALRATRSISSIAFFIGSSARRRSLHAVTRHDRFRKGSPPPPQTVVFPAELAGDPFALIAVIKACVAPRHLHSGRRVHDLCVVSGNSSDPYVRSSLLHMYLRCRDTADAHKVFDETPDRSAMITGYARDGRLPEALRLLDLMRDSGVEPNLVCWNGMIAGLCNGGRPLDAMAVFARMRSEGFAADGTGISSVLPAAGDTRDAGAGSQVHCYSIKCGSCSDACVVSALVDMYGKCGLPAAMAAAFDDVAGDGKLDVASCNALVAGLSRNALADDALREFTRFRDMGIELNVVSWTSIVACCAQNGKDMEALELFRAMRDSGVEPNSVTIPSMLPACANVAALTHGKSAHCFALRKGIHDDVFVASALVDMYGKCGKVNVARKVFDEIPKRNVVSWNAMLSGYSMHGKAEEAMELFDAMLRRGQRPDHISFTCVLQACSQAGLVEEGRRHFKGMSEEFKLAARPEHYACMVTLLGRSGRLAEAHELIGDMGFEPDACIWGSLLSSSRVHGNVRLGEIAARKLFDLEPENAGNYVILSNIYAAKGMWVEVDRMRERIKATGLRKDPGCSWIEIKGKVHTLLAGDTKHPRASEIADRLSRLIGEMRRIGYLQQPSTAGGFVLHDVGEEEDREQILGGHSEKLAVALGLISTPPGTPLMIIKNLRMCGDCHQVFKFIAMAEGREISVRDTNRFHHFGCGGECSCRDFW